VGCKSPSDFIEDIILLPDYYELVPHKQNTIPVDEAFNSVKNDLLKFECEFSSVKIIKIAAQKYTFICQTINRLYLFYFACT